MRKITSIILLGFLFFFTSYSYGQVGQISGVVIDNLSKDSLPYVQVTLLFTKDSLILDGVETNQNGEFTIPNIQVGNYIIKVSSFGYKTIIQPMTITEKSQRLDFKLVSTAKLIDGVEITGTAVRVEQKGDTTQYNADAFKTNPDATVQDLVTKMPGITVENGVVKAQGEQITKVLIDGQEFFGDDANAALKNLPAEMVSKIQVYDQSSDQAKFTGISDGNESKALNIVTKAGKNQGQFGKIYAGYGTPNNLYIGGLNVNFFKGKRRISIIGMSNNVNQQNFSTDDILGVTNSTSTQQRRGPGGGGNSNENYLVSQQNGISTTHSLGINYSDYWGKQTKVNGSYFFNYSQTDNSQLTARNYVLSKNSGQVYNEDFSSLMKNMNHRFNIKWDITLDTMNSLVINPKFTYQGNNKDQGTNAKTTDGYSELLNSITNTTSSNNVGLTASNSVLWRHRFAKPKRTFSTELTGSLNLKNGTSGQNSLTYYYNQTADSSSAINQQSLNETNGYAITGRFSYTEPLSKLWSGELYYAPSYTVSDADKRTYNFDSINGLYSLIDTSLSNVFDNRTIVNEGGANLRFQKNKLNMQFGLAYQNSTLLNDQEFPVLRDSVLSFNSIIPNIRMRYAFSKTKSLMLNYRANTKNPTIDQLQNVIDNSNPLSLSQGNPSLKQQYNHNVFGRFNVTNVKKGTNFNVFFGGQLNSNYISTSTFIASSDTTLDGISLQRGAQYKKPVNLTGSWNSRTTIAFGFPLTKLKLNMNFFLGGAYTVLPGLINEQVNYSKTANSNLGLTIASNISEKIDFTVGYTLNYNNVVNTSTSLTGSDYFIHNINARFNWIIKERLVINTNYTVAAYAGLGSGYNQTIMLWNGGIGYKLLKNKQLEARISVFDIMNNNNSITRNVTETYIEDVQSLVLNRYYMFTLTYSLRNFGKKSPEAEKVTNTGEQGSPRDGMPPPPDGGGRVPF